MHCSVDIATFIQCQDCSVQRSWLHCTVSGLQCAVFCKHGHIIQCQDCSVQCSVDIATLYSVRIAVCSVL